MHGDTTVLVPREHFAVTCMDTHRRLQICDRGRWLSEEAKRDAGAEADRREAQPLSKEEELLRERTRSKTTGVSMYKVREDGVILFTSGLVLNIFFPTNASGVVGLGKGTYKVFDFLSAATKERYPHLATRPSMHYDIDQSHCATSREGRAVTVTPITFVNSNNVYEMRIVEDAAQTQPFDVHVRQLTSIGDELHPCGVADYIMQEEFDRFAAHASRRRAGAIATDGDRTRALTLLYTYTDCTRTREVHLLKGTVSLPDAYPAEAFDAQHHFHPDAEAEREESVEQMPYPRVGDPNARSCLALLQDECADTPGRRCYLPPGAIDRVAPWAEYIPRFGFKNENEIYFTLLDRKQERHAIYSCPIKDLPTLTCEEDLKSVFAQSAPSYHEGPRKVPLTLEWQQHVPWAWVEVQPGPPIFFTAQGDFVVAHAARETPAADDADATAHYHLFYRRPAPAAGPGEHAAPAAAAWVPLTTGPWNVTPRTVQLRGAQVFFTANAHDRIGTALYGLSLEAFLHDTAAAARPFDAAALTRLSPVDEHVVLFTLRTPADGPGGSSGASGDAGRATPTTIYYMTTTRQTPAKLYRCQVQGRTVEPREPLQLPPWTPELFSRVPVVKPRVVTVKNRRGVALSGLVYVSPKYEKSQNRDQRGPLALYVYGGPHVQLVHRHAYYAMVHAQVQVLLQEGIHVAVVDNQMSNANGLRDLSICKNNMGRFETDDYVDFVHYLTASPTLIDDATPSPLPPFTLLVDPKRVAIFGWSYGGYATLLAMCQAPHVFRIGFAGAPVGDWRLYDTGYTERYLGLLTDAEAAAEALSTEAVAVRSAYLRSAISHYASGFPDDMNRVFIAHGLLDENVHFTNSCSVVQAMIAEGKPYSMLVYPGERHGLRQQAASRLHYESMLVKTLVELL
ncbi:dipeptidyl-peptidase 9 [Strigomonas culicis]|uniref:Dipeptidyl-peptidase 9 n=1 Tax=Strigomonas culicis TaxID=28005 RepID=S9VXN2_9TRYP|nr:dipeptidyl-peptidase 9 [Strigomonas culicis]|eukprot:EPY31826.1 dipeptidyl-peptidase 9 [Strigomonas culicis]